MDFFGILWDCLRFFGRIFWDFWDPLKLWKDFLDSCGVLKLLLKELLGLFDVLKGSYGIL